MKSKLRKILKKVLIIILILLLLNNFFINSNISLATSDEAVKVDSWLDDILGTVVGLLTWPIRVIAVGIGWAVDKLIVLISYSQGGVNEAGKIDTGLTDNVITPFDILFNKIALVNINFFDISAGGNSVISNIRTSIAAWYYTMRNVAAVILLCVLIYVGIRMAISTIASDKAVYKKMLIDWICSLALIFLLQYIIIFTINVNEVLVRALNKVGKRCRTYRSYR